MRRWMSLFLLLSLLLAPSALAEGMQVSGENTSEVYCPDGSDAQTAQYVYRYSYPLLEDTGETARMINDFYDYLVSDAKDFLIPMTFETLDGAEMQSYTAITSQVMCNNDQYFSVLVNTESFIGAETNQVLAGHTFALQGAQGGHLHFPAVLSGTAGSGRKRSLDAGPSHRQGERTGIRAGMEHH